MDWPRQTKHPRCVFPGRSTDLYKPCAPFPGLYWNLPHRRASRPFEGRHTRRRGKLLNWQKNITASAILTMKITLCAHLPSNLLWYRAFSCYITITWKSSIYQFGVQVMEWNYGSLCHWQVFEAFWMLQGPILHLGLAKKQSSKEDAERWVRTKARQKAKSVELTTATEALPSIAESGETQSLTDRTDISWFAWSTEGTR